MSETVKAQRTDIAIGSLTVDGFMLPDGSYRMSQTQAAEAVDLSERNARDFLRSKAIKGLLGEGYTPAISVVEIESTEQARGQSRISALPLEAVSAYWLWQSHRGNKKALALCIALITETLESRFDAAFAVQRTEDERNQLLSARVQRLEQDLEALGDAYALDDEVKRERDRFEKLLRQNGIDPYGLPDGE